ncbi:MAG: hypothetical protein ACP5HM_06755 [Anaerolineae bacterium]
MKKISFHRQPRAWTALACAVLLLLGGTFLYPAPRLSAAPAERRYEASKVEQAADDQDKLSSALVHKIARAAPADTFQVLIWLDDGGQIPVRPRPLPETALQSVTETEVRLAQHRRRIQQALSDVQGPVRAQVVALDGRVRFVSRYAPLIVAELTPDALRTLAARPDVLYVDLDSPLGCS